MICAGVKFKTCISCGAPFEALTKRRVLCTPDCGRVRSNKSKHGARAKYRAERIPEFVGVDGEGVTLDDGTHKYVLLSVGEKSFHRDGAHLSFDDVAQFLWECFEENPEGIYCGYYLGYDFAQWLRTLPENRAAMLYAPEKRARTKSGNNPTPFPVYYEDWEFDILGTKRFKLRRRGAKAWLYINDVGGFFQQPFATAILGWQDRSGNPISIASNLELEIIERGKAKRATAEFDLEMIEYNITENRVLSRMLQILSQGFADMGVKLLRDQYYGPGQVAQKWMDQHSTHAAKVLHARVSVDPTFAEAINAARQAYFGGWFETYAHGHIRGVSYEYDIASAYPHIHSRLPCLLHGKWERTLERADKITGEFVLVRADVEGSNKYIGAMLHRDKTGKINRPNFTSGWYWRHELEAATRAGVVDEMTIHEAFKYTPCDCPPPMADLRDQYKHRIEVGKNTPHGRSLKLNYNSCYGKTAQSIGTPKHANAIHASLITAGCRTMILDAIATHPKGAASVLMIATDGIYFDAPHPGLQNQSAELGNWEEQLKHNLTIFLPGVYWDDASRESRKKKVLKLKSRGVSGADLITRLDDLDAQFERMLSLPEIPGALFEGHAPPDWWTKLDLPIRFSMVSPKQALQRGKWELAGTVSQNGERTLFAHPRHKRELVFLPTAERPYIHSTRPTNRERVACTPYSRSFGMHLQEKVLADYVLTPEGDAISEAYEIMRGEAEF